mmetsp:Transcript_3326/g.4432  ORF Transcript_3326/g.4432 Transcript_3326/m.4432 type:complete len:356 (-) Transcript_3326:188-1255(-)
MKVPTIDIGPFLEPGSIAQDAARKEVANEIRAACESHGFFYITGIDDESIVAMSKAITQTKQFFDNDNQEFMNHYKRECTSRHSKLYRGYTQAGGGNNCVSASREPELKESFTIGAEGDDKSPMHGPNLFPTTRDYVGNGDTNGNKNSEEDFCQSFRHDMTNYYDCMLQLSRHVAHALALSLNLQGDFFTNRMKDPVAQLVAFKYPPEEQGVCTTKKNKQISCGEHTDCGFLTLLVQTAPGLEVFSKATQSWHIVKPIDNTVLVNLGDLTQFWTNCKYKSTLHRVHNKSSTDRHSLIFFANCDFDARLDDLGIGAADDGKSGQQNENTTTGESVTAGAYLLEKLGLMWLMNEDNK